MSAPPAVTVVVVCFNHAAYVEELLDSVLEQTHPPQRVIIFDDQSTDDSPDVIRRWIANAGVDYELIVHEVNAGLCHTLNEALDMIDTPMYTYISADDRMMPTRLGALVNRWLDDGGRAAAIYSDAQRIDKSGKPLNPDYRVLHDWPTEPGALEGNLHFGLLRQCWLPAASVMVATEAVRRVGGYDERWFFEDYDLWLRLAASERFILVDEPLVQFRELDSSLGHRRFRDEDLGLLSARVGIYLKQVGVSRQGDEYLRVALPPLAIRLWKASGDTRLAADALSACQRIRWSPGLALRLMLMQLGFATQPRWMTRAESIVHDVRDRLSRQR